MRFCICASDELARWAVCLIRHGHGRVELWSALLHLDLLRPGTGRVHRYRILGVVFVVGIDIDGRAWLLLLLLCWR